MSDEADVNLEEESKDGEAAGKKPGPGLLPKLLKFIAIGLGALIFIVTVTIITFNIMNKGGKSQTVVPLTDSYAAVKKQYAMFTLIGNITTRTRDQLWNVSVDVILGYDLNDNASATELTSSLYLLRDSVRNYFNSKSAAELQPENESRIKNELRERLNTTVLDKARVRIILFDKLDLYEME
jgi:flagellar FliL protein